jgi:conserved hypothetical protein TIGR00247
MSPKIFRYSLLAVLLLVAGGAFFLFVSVKEFLDSPLHIAPGGPAYFEVEKGWTLDKTISRLLKRGFFSSPTLCRLAYKFFQPGGTVKAGEYEFTPPITVRQAVIKIFNGKVYLVPITIPEGLTSGEILALVGSGHPAQAVGMAKAMTDVALISDLDPAARNLEGYLFPETYLVPRKAVARDLVRSMTVQFRREFDESLRKRAAELGMSPRQVVTLASLIEKETALAGERPRVSAVFHNRLKIGMKLDCDPTVIYALELAGLYKGRLLKKDLVFQSPYNTYANRGLPPGPICNPGRDSIRAALYPEDVDYLYFMARGDGSHQFNSTYERHLAAVRKFRLK